MNATVDVNLGFFPLMWILFLIKPWLSVDGAAGQKTWGTHTLQLAPGSHTIEAWFPYFFSSQTSKGSITIDVAAGGNYKLRYRPAMIVFLAGSMKLVSTPALPQATARELPPGAA
jgi:hypothetical protein